MESGARLDHRGAEVEEVEKVSSEQINMDPENIGKPPLIVVEENRPIGPWSPFLVRLQRARARPYRCLL